MGFQRFQDLNEISQDLTHILIKFSVSYENNQKNLLGISFKQDFSSNLSICVLKISACCRPLVTI